MDFRYDTVGNSSYLVATFANGQGLINYQVQMLANNKIKNIIGASRRQKNEDVEIFYNITSKISLNQATARSRISKEGLIHIIEGAVAALEDIEGYQLVSSGILFDPEYIYVNPQSYEPGFIYVPDSWEDTGIEPLRKLILNLIMSSKVETTNDNFVQIILEALNDVSVTLDTLKKLCAQFKSGRKPQRAPKEPEPAREPKRSEIPAEQPAAPRRSEAPPVRPAQPEPQPKMPPERPYGMPANKPVNPQPESKPKESGGQKKDSSKTVIFAAVQAAAVIILAALVFSGVLNDEKGALNVTYLAAAVLLVGAVDFILYRELFVNNKKDKGNKNEAKPAVSQQPPMPGRNNAMPKPPVPGRNNAAPKPEMQRQPEIPRQQEVPPVRREPAPPVPNVTRSVPQPNMSSPASSYGDYVGEFDNENTVVLDESSTEAHLEYYENGLMRKIMLTGERTIVGKLKAQCDYAFNNNKVSKIHAEFISRNGEYFVKDFNSTNGTFINGARQRITSNTEYRIYNGDRITLADTDLIFRC